MAETPLTQYLRPDVIRRISRLDLQAKCIVEGFLAGLHRSPFHGFSTEFSEHREYGPGDDLKFIDWNVYSKTERFYIKKYEAQTNLECTLIIDISSSMAYRYHDDQASKLDYATYLAAAIGYLLLKQRDAVGMVTFDDRLRQYLKPRSKPTQMAAIIAALAKSTPQTTTNFEVIGTAATLLRHRGLVVVFSDFLDNVDAALNSLKKLRFKGHDIVVFHILDKAEIDLPFDQSMRFVDAEDDSNQVVAVADHIRDAYREEIRAFTARVEKACNDLQIHYVGLNTSQQFDVALRQFLLERKMRA